jgi:L-galactose dehydrogenase
VDESLARLGVDYVDIIQSHDNEYGNLDQVVDETIPALRKLQQMGKARLVGITGYPLKVFSYIIARTDVDTILSYNHYALNDTTLTNLIPFLESKSVGIISASPVSQGLLTNQGTPEWHPAPNEVKRVCAGAAAFCREQGADLAKLAMQFAIANPRIATTVVGTANPENIKKNVQWIEEPVDRKLITEVQEILASIKDQTWIVGRRENN